jgi:hypothetical protein
LYAAETIIAVLSIVALFHDKPASAGASCDRAIGTTVKKYTVQYFIRDI